jgi:DNA repair exonuclease SbcCD ATPase subunit
MNELSQTKDSLRQAQAGTAQLEQQLSGTREELVQTEDQLRSTSQKLRATQRDMESTKTDLTAAQDKQEALTEELKTVRSDLIRVNREKFELNQKIESVEEEKRSLAKRVEQLEGGAPESTMVADGSPDAQADEDADQISRLQAELDAARATIQRLSNNPVGAALATGSGGDETLNANQVRVRSLNLDRGLIVLTPSSDDEFVGVSTITMNRNGTPVANLRLRGVYPDYLVAEILPDSAFVDALESGSVYSYR